MSEQHSADGNAQLANGRSSQPTVNGVAKPSGQDRPRLSVVERVFLWSPRTFITGALLAAIAAVVPTWLIFLTWTVFTEVSAVAFDVAGWWRRRMHKAANKQNGRSPALRKFTWEEVREHNTGESLWLAIHGKVYDVTEFADSHPGGRDFLLFTAGRDVTHAFDTYHPFTDKPRQIMSKYLIGELVSHQFPPYRPDSGFYKECCERVGEYFKRTGLDPKSPWAGLWRMAAVYSVMAVSFCVCYAWGSSIPWIARVCAAVLFGCCGGVTLVHWYHDGSHGSLGHSTFLWGLATRCTDYVLGSSILSWNHQHVLGHHLHTNVIGVDPDIDQSMRRISTKQIWKTINRYQHIFMPILYLFLAVKSRFEDGGIMTFVFRRNGPMEINPPTNQDFLRNIAAKSFWAFYQISVPYFVFAVPFMDVLILSFIIDLAIGGWLTFNSQVSHVQEVSFYTEGDQDEKVLPEEWAIAQVKTCIDYAHGYSLDTFLSGALNYQTIHHLFPGVSQYHYPQIAPIVKDVCTKFNVPFTHKPDYWTALRDHILYLKKMGEEGRFVGFKMD